ncbi:ABC transporter substrate-binding protein [Actinomyces sp. ZJ308]|uniref:ABC transporter substrate-binding protein n=1 Tax=Actinomyces sp. ZJ308 TaxID=2708342 RepID=UPI00141FAA62|nr:ABC transporter substrate-binding protein [Actinomyces sp. ZJ308]
MNATSLTHAVVPSPEVSRRRLLALLGLGASTAAVAACSGRAGTGSAGGRIRLAMLQPPRSGLNPLSDDAFKLSRWSCAETLINLDAEGNAVAGLATAWEQQADNPATWRLTIRDGVTFHDGTALDAARAAACLTFAAGYTTPPRVLDGTSLTATAEGSTLVVTTAAPDPLLPQRLSSPQLAILAAAAYPDGNDGAVDPVGHGTGAFRLTKVNGTAGATLERNDKYWGTKAAAPGIDVTFVPDGTARGAALRTGEADLVEAVPVAQAATLDEALLHEVPMPRTATLYLNTRSGPFTDPALRAAVRDAVDPAALVTGVYEGHADPAAGLLGPALPWAAQQRAWGSTTYAGTSGAAATGKVPGATAAGSVPAGTTVTLGSYTDRPELAEIVGLLADQLKKIGVSVTQDVREYSQMEADALAGKFDMVLLSRATVLDSGDPVAYMVSDFSSSGSFALSLLSDAAVDQALTTAGATAAGPERHKAVMAAEQAILATGAAVPLLHERVLQGEAAGLKGAERDPRERALITSATELT